MVSPNAKEVLISLYLPNRGDSYSLLYHASHRQGPDFVSSQLILDPTGAIWQPPKKGPQLPNFETTADSPKALQTALAHFFAIPEGAEIETYLGYGPEAYNKGKLKPGATQRITSMTVSYTQGEASVVLDININGHVGLHSEPSQKAP